MLEVTVLPRNRKQMLLLHCSIKLCNGKCEELHLDILLATLKLLCPLQ
uniref:Uncharacterized protein n=1 Tax=Arundo donax TaxID=35708 RepID=A0A0A9FXD7_ARUDO